jgi:hypothetical protein
MKEIIITNKNGITLKTAGTIVQEDIKLVLDSSLSPSYEDGDIIKYGSARYTVYFDNVGSMQSGKGSGFIFYSLDNGDT